MAKRRFVIREVDAALLRRNSSLSKHARHLHGTLRAMADAKTGELRIGKHWYGCMEIEREAEMCERIRIPAMRELFRAGLAHSERERRTITVKERFSGRLRRKHVLGQAHFFVSPTPRLDWLANISPTDFRAGSSRNTHKQRRPSKPQNMPNRPYPPKHSVSSKRQSVPSAPNAESILISTPPSGGPDGDVGSDVGSAGESSQAAAENHHAKFLAATTAINEAFALLNSGSPYGSPAFQLLWLDAVNDSPNHHGDVRTKEYPFMHAWLPDAIERCIQACHRARITIPKPIYRDKRMAEQARAVHCQK